MSAIGKRVTVTIEGFGSKQGVIESYIPDIRTSPYHVVFDDGMDGWFNGEQCGLYRWAKATDASRRVVRDSDLRAYDNCIQFMALADALTHAPIEIEVIAREKAPQRETRRLPVFRRL